MGEPNLSSIILPTLEEDLSDMAHQLLGVPLAMAKRWCTLDKLNVQTVFKYFSQQAVPLAGVKRTYCLNAFCLSILARYFLVHEKPRADPRILSVVNNLGKGTPIILILAKTLNGLDEVHRVEAVFFAGTPLLVQIWLYERLQLLHPPNVSPSQYQPTHYRDLKLKSKEMDLAEFTEFGDRHGVPSDDGSFHTLAFIERILGRICETWSRRMTTKDICF